jgi:hypothetical protein
VVEEAESFAGLRGAIGAGIAFEIPALGERIYNRLKKMSLLRDARLQRARPRLRPYLPLRPRRLRERAPPDGGGKRQLLRHPLRL